MDMDYVIPNISNPEVVLSEAREWIEQYYSERNLSKEVYPFQIMISFSLLLFCVAFYSLPTKYLRPTSYFFDDVILLPYACAR